MMHVIIRMINSGVGKRFFYMNVTLFKDVRPIQIVITLRCQQPPHLVQLHRTQHTRRHIVRLLQAMETSIMRRNHETRSDQAYSHRL